MKRIIRFFLSVGLVFCACGHAAAPPIIENEMQEPKRIASLANNVGAYVWVYCFWRSQSDPDPESSNTWDINIGVVLDEYHVLTTQCQDESEANGWEDGYLESITVGLPDENNQSGIGPHKASLTAEDTSGTDLVVVTIDNTSTPLPSIVPAAKKPEICDRLYTLTSIAGDADLSNVELFTVKATKYESDPFSPNTNPQPDFAVLVPTKGGYPAPTAVFNQDNEFVGFILSGSVSHVAMPLRAPEEFQSGSPYVDAYDILSIHGKILTALFHKAGVSWSE